MYRTDSLVQYFPRPAFLNFTFNFISSCFFLYLKVYANEAECKQWRHERLANFYRGAPGKTWLITAFRKNRNHNFQFVKPRLKLEITAALKWRFKTWFSWAMRGTQAQALCSYVTAKTWWYKLGFDRSGDGRSGRFPPVELSSLCCVRTKHNDTDGRNRCLHLLFRHCYVFVKPVFTAT